MFPPGKGHFLAFPQVSGLWADSRGLLGMEGAEPDLGNLGIDIRVVSPDGEDGVKRVMAAWKERCPSTYLS